MFLMKKVSNVFKKVSNQVRVSSGSLKEPPNVNDDEDPCVHLMVKSVLSGIEYKGGFAPCNLAIDRGLFKFSNYRIVGLFYSTLPVFQTKITKNIKQISRSLNDFDRLKRILRDSRTSLTSCHNKRQLGTHGTAQWKLKSRKRYRMTTEAQKIRK